ncbi:hypothetical protein AB6A40_002558 [Gnathostoma spinigerum]|uniref:Sphingomyelin phosphodiesterase 4 n=1 Tax=Gnathostoma spinigerum TaxID=75299 RepID=A0ABD6ECH3_9BILA
MFFEEVSPLSVACTDLIRRSQSQNYTTDVYFVEAVIDRLLKDPSIDLLSVFPDANRVEYNQVIELIGTKSHIFKALLDGSSEVFEFFITTFCEHLERSTCNLPLKMVENSVYMQLLSDYVCHMMPTGSEPPLSGGHDIAGLSPSTSTFNTPLNLFREEYLRRYAVSSSSTSFRALSSFSQSLQPHFITFINVLVRSLSSLSSWPSDYRLMALRFTLKELHFFALAESENASLASVKAQLHCNAPFADSLLAFFVSMFNKWPANASFKNLFDVWITWIRPWRCLPEHRRSDINQLLPFVLENRKFYVDVSDAFWRRRFPIQCPSDVKTLENYMIILISPEFVTIYDAIQYPIEEKLLLMRSSLLSSASDLRTLIRSERAQLASCSWLYRNFFSDESYTRIREAEETSYLAKLLASKIGAAIPGGASSFEFSADAANTSEVFSTEGRSPRGKGSIPDHVVDPKTKLMRLTPEGLKQVKRGTHRFDFSYCPKSVPPLVRSLNTDEVWWLARFLFNLSCLLNQTNVAKALSNAYNDHNSILGLFARLLLDPAYPRHLVPVYSSTIYSQKPCFNLRYFAKYKFIIPFCIFCIVQLFLPYTYSFLIFGLLLAYVRLI